MDFDNQAVPFELNHDNERIGSIKPLAIHFCSQSELNLVFCPKSHIRANSRIDGCHTLQ